MSVYLILLTLTSTCWTPRTTFGLTNCISKRSECVQNTCIKSSLPPPHEQRLAVHLALSAPKPFEPFANWLFRGSLDTVTEHKCFA
ncbi:hypothetical protein IG631_15071 [Alternaria alternata]|nr:hypothetical protein IG631_15071 [Alternaria alternata]